MRLSTASVCRMVICYALMWCLTLGIAMPARAAHNLNASWKDVPVAPYQNYIRYLYHSSVPAPFKPRILDGRRVWNEVGRELYFQVAASNHLITITYEDLWFPNGDALAISMTFAGPCFPRICTGSIAYNTTPSNFLFYTGTGSPNGANNEVDLWSVAAHEWGHQVSLTHSGYLGDTMHGTITAGDISKRDLKPHDEDGIRALYGPK